MKIAQITEIADAVLYEGYLLYPYRQSALKNQQRWTYGVVYPRQYSDANGCVEPWRMRTECLFAPHHNAVPPTFDITVRFLHLLTCEAEPTSVAQKDRRLSASENWQEAIACDVHIDSIGLHDLCTGPLTKEIRFPEQHHFDRDRQIVRQQRKIEGRITLDVAQVDATLSRLSVTIENTTPVVSVDIDHYQAILPCCFVSTHTILQVQHGAFISLLDPPEQWKDAVGSCDNEHTWPVLVGQPGAQDAMLSSPIILYDYPRIAPESLGTLFDGTEIDELLILRILTLSDEEKQELRQGDSRARELLERTEQLTPDQMAQLHGTIREMRPLAGVQAQDGEAALPTRVQVRGGDVGVGDHVRLHPSARADAFDLLLKGQLARVEEIKQDMDERTYLVVTIDCDPGREQFDERVMPGHRFFFFPEEAEPVSSDQMGMHEGRSL